MAGKGKKKTTAADEAENSLGPGLEQPLEEEKTEKNIDRNQKDKKYHKKVKLLAKIQEIFCEQPKIINKFKIFLEKLRKSIEESPEFKLKVDKAICGEPKITKKFKDKKIEKSSKNDGIDKLWELLDENTFHCLCELEMGIRYLAEIGTPSEPPNAAAGSSGSPHNEECKVIILQKWLELVKEFCEELGITEKFKVFCEKKVEEQGKFCAELGMASDDLWENGANQHSNKEIQVILKNFAENPLATLEENLEMIQTGGLEGVTAMNSSSFGAMGTPLEQARELKRKGEEELDGARFKRPATAYPSPSRPPIGGFMAEARQNYGQSVAALATQGPLLSTNKGTQRQLREATHDGEASTSSWAPPPHHELGLGSKQEVSMYNLVKQHMKLKDAKRRQQEAAAASIDANRKFKEKKKEADNLDRQVKELEEGIGKLEAELAEKGKISKDALDLHMIDAVTLGWNLMKELLQFMQPGSEFLNLPLLDAIELYPSLQNQFNEGLTLIGQGHPINDKVAIHSDNPPVVMLDSFFWDDNWLENVMACDNLVDASETDNLDWMPPHCPDGGEDP